MAWLSLEIIIAVLFAAAFGVAVGWGLHALFGNALFGSRSAHKTGVGGFRTVITDPTGKLRVAALEAKLDKANAEAEDLRRRSGIGRPGERPVAAPEGSLAWRNRHLESRVRFLEGKLADLESDAKPAPPREDQNDLATRLRWRNRYLEGRVKYLEEELVRTGGLPSPVNAPLAPQAAPKMRDADKPELFK